MKYEIEFLLAGDDLDALIAEYLFEYRWIDTHDLYDHPVHALLPKDWNFESLPGCSANHKRDLYAIQPYKYSTNIAAAWMVVQKLRPLFRFVLGEVDSRRLWFAQFENIEHFGEWAAFENEAKTAPLAISRAALLTVKLHDN